MGNLKSKKLKISEATSDDKQNEERINTIKTDISDASRSINEDHKEKDDNASSASTVEILDDK
ncbi:Uncharacterized protein OBRU01_04186 [Operophtera brumata]|uniref:Uncharacterized protein n=1 Tax=Operophtera brumata TaxID=104452 RepID=A0A0L7LPQ3_OPEBR|nr:Uncharacterized protein OBRU01_04186 [Operophtera brumata]